ncbi:LOB domain-containing protein 2 [Durio zibethinus]|uniref:LOB domain-containing protein 2 n=1 Tax=Durio zibethinus TaxID=66656 RepID=A0A6P6BAF6_DURZI|nr:LOB domain-containing protein 2 [Durio zibethinus]
MQRYNNNGVAAASGVHSACAACKHQRKKCDENCILAPYFPADKCREFQAVHKVFGVSNATKIVRNANSEEDRKKVADSLIWEAFCWQKDSVLGPYGEYKKIYEEFTLYKRQNQMMLLQDHNEPQVLKMATAHAHAHAHASITPTWNINSNAKRLVDDVKGSIGNAALRCYNQQDAHGNSLVGFSGSYGYPIPSHSEKLAVQEKGIHNPLQYYTTSGLIHGKTLESARWDNVL